MQQPQLVPRGSGAGPQPHRQPVRCVQGFLRGLLCVCVCFLGAGTSPVPAARYGVDVEVDWKGEDVTVDNLLRLLTGRLPPGVAPPKRLASHAGSNLLLYMTGHGGDGFLKFQDATELSAHDLADAVEEMHAKGRFREALMLFDTCEAESLGAAIRTPGVASVGSSRTGQNAYSHSQDPQLALPLADGFTYFVTTMFEGSAMRAGTHAHSLSLAQLLDHVPRYRTRSDAVVRTDLMGRPPERIMLSEFMCAVSDVMVF